MHIYRLHLRLANEFAPTVFRPAFGLGFLPFCPAPGLVERLATKSTRLDAELLNNPGLPCGSEFIREGSVQPMHIYRLHLRLANEFAPTVFRPAFGLGFLPFCPAPGLVERLATKSTRLDAELLNNPGLPCGSEFIREGPVQPMYIYRLHLRLANEFAPTVFRPAFGLGFLPFCPAPGLVRRLAAKARGLMQDL